MASDTVPVVVIISVQSTLLNSGDAFSCHSSHITYHMPLASPITFFLMLVLVAFSLHFSSCWMQNIIMIVLESLSIPKFEFFAFDYEWTKSAQRDVCFLD